ncbi:glycosyltransferase family 2 protein [Methanosphaera sp. ISO3-F5]|uniref:glycosyltransferase family 2 protein n=1 Tax=Methanosphaera sp. ISO3-F5 TaxID=1452353 RepID=UPI002B25D8E4|nr:glycosyltransferase family 2 protein [Methanosphaera sp. ISO3-F5]WQH65120.1 glycosyltransferase family 2 protein [Methanosphaera sp. ISO3-F5]
MDLSIIIVNYRTYELTKQTINSVIETVIDLDYEIIVVDNASCDGSLEKLIEDFESFNNITFLANKTNDGFAVANNLALKESVGDYVLLLNSDVIVKENTINKSLNFIKNNSNIGILGCKVVLPDGTLDKACRRSFPTFEVSFYRMSGLSKIFPNSKRFNRYNLSYLDENGTYPVDCVVGAFMLIRSNLLKECNGLDESFFMYGEDIDICYRIKQMGYEVYYYGEYEIIHYKGASGKNKKLLYEFHNSMEIFYNKHYKKQDSFLINALTYISIWTLYYLKLLVLSLKTIF